MTDARGKNAERTRGRPFQPGNPGRPAGSRNRATVAVEALLEGEAEGLARKAVELAMAGDTVALRLCLDRIAPPRKGRPVSIDLPPVETAAGCAAAVTAVVAAVSEGSLTPEEGQAVAGLLEARRRALETEDLERRIAVLERQTAKGRHG